MLHSKTNFAKAEFAKIDAWQIASLSVYLAFVIVNAGLFLSVDLDVNLALLLTCVLIELSPKIEKNSFLMENHIVGVGKNQIPKAMQKLGVRKLLEHVKMIRLAHGFVQQHTRAIDVLANIITQKNVSIDPLFNLFIIATTVNASIVTLNQILQSAIVSHCSSLRKALRLTVLRTCLSNAVLATASSITPFIPLRGNGSSFAWGNT